MCDQSCSTSDPKRSWSVKIDQIENVTVSQGFSLSLGFVCKCVSAKNVRSSLYLDLKKGFVVAAITPFHSTGDTHHTKSQITCETFDVIYLIQCRLCNLQYIGETKRRLKDRFNEHRWPILNPTGDYIHTAVSEHFLTSNHSDNHMLLIPIEKLKNGRDSFRNAREAHIIHKAKTIEPLSINKRDELYLYKVYLLFFCYLVF